MQRHIAGFYVFMGRLGASDFQPISEWLECRIRTAAVFVNYTRSPEAHYYFINQAYNATKWVAEYGNEIGVDGKRLAVAETVLEETWLPLLQ
jgi:hypothetical protein